MASAYGGGTEKTSRFKVLLSKEEEIENRVREGFSILVQGIELIHYETLNMLIGGKKNKKIFWMDADVLRFCCEFTRPTLTDRAKGKVAYGLYLRDIAEVREGAEAYDFRRNPSPPAPDEEDKCLSLIGTECCLCLQFPTKFTRDWFLERFQLIIDDVLTEQEKILRRGRNLKTWLFASLNEEQLFSAEQMRSLLLRGIQILHHHPNGSVIRSYIVYDEENKRLLVQPVKTYWFSFFQPKLVSLHISDISEIRPGTHAVGFVRTNSTDKGSECLSLIGTEGTIDLQLATNNARDLFALKIRCFMQYVEQTSARQEEELAAAAEARAAQEAEQEEEYHAQNGGVYDDEEGGDQFDDYDDNGQIANVRI